MPKVLDVQCFREFPTDVQLESGIFRGFVWPFSLKNVNVDKRRRSELAELYTRENILKQDLNPHRSYSTAEEEEVVLRKVHTNIGDLRSQKTQRLLADFISVLNNVYPRNDFSNVNPSHFRREKSVKTSLITIHNILAPLAKVETLSFVTQDFLLQVENWLGKQQDWVIYSFTPGDSRFRPICINSVDFFFICGKKLLYMSFSISLAEGLSDENIETLSRSDKEIEHLRTSSPTLKSLSSRCYLLSGSLKWCSHVSPEEKAVVEEQLKREAVELDVCTSSPTNYSSVMVTDRPMLRARTMQLPLQKMLQTVPKRLPPKPNIIGKNTPLPEVNVMNDPTWKLCSRSAMVSRIHPRRFEVRPIAKHKEFRDNNKRTKRNVKEANLDVLKTYSSMSSPVESPVSSSSSIEELNCPMIEAALPEKRRSGVIDLRTPCELPTHRTQTINICSSDDSEIEVLIDKSTQWVAKPPRRRQKLTHPTLAEKLKSSLRTIPQSKVKSNPPAIQPMISSRRNESGDYNLTTYALKQIQTKAPPMPRLENPDITYQ